MIALHTLFLIPFSLFFIVFTCTNAQLEHVRYFEKDVPEPSVESVIAREEKATEVSQPASPTRHFSELEHQVVTSINAFYMGILRGCIM